MTTPAPLPNAPTSPQASADSTGVYVTFVASDNATVAEVNSYTVLAYNLTSGQNDASATGTSSPIQVENLTRNCDYAFSVIANGSSGASPESLLSNTVQPLSTPDPPTDVIAVAGDTQAVVSFSAPHQTGGTSITHYTAYATDTIVTANGGQQVSASASPITVPGLTNGDGYTFVVSATNSIGDSVPSSVSPLCTPLPSTPSGSIVLYPNSLQFTVTKKINQVQLVDEILSATGVSVTLALQLESGVTQATPAHPGTVHVTPNTVNPTTVQTVLDAHVAQDGYGLSQEAQDFQRVLQLVMGNPAVTLDSDDLQVAVRELLLQLNVAPFLSGDVLNLPTDSYLTAEQTANEIIDLIANHNINIIAHPDLRDLIASSGGTGGTGVSETRQITAGPGLTGGGDLSQDRTLAVDFGIAENNAVRGNDTRLGNARTPTAHESSHASDGSDPLSPLEIGAATVGHSHLLAQGPPVSLTDAATISTNAATGTFFRVSINGNRTLGAPSNPTDGQVVTWEITATNAIRTLTLPTGNGGFVLSNVAAIITTLAIGQKMTMTAAYNVALNQWIVMACVPHRQTLYYPASVWTIQANTGSPPHISLPNLLGSEIARVAIPDPGFPYLIEASAACEIQNASGVRWDIEFRLDGVASGYTRFGGFGTSVTDATRTAILPLASSVTLTGIHTLYVVGFGVGSTSSNGWVTTYARHFLAKAVPQ